MDRRISSLRFLLLWVGLWLAPHVMADDCRLDTLLIDVLLKHDGSAIISETRHIEVNNDFTEWYIVHDHLDDMEIDNFSVTDESGKSYAYEEEWNIDRSREEKAGRCGIVCKGGDDYELCWGVGSAGPHIYTARYTMSHLVKSFAEADGFNHMFVARSLSPAPLAVRTVIAAEDSLFTPSNTQLWAFGYVGRIEWREGKIVAETTQPFGDRSSMIIMARFEKGVFAPVSRREGTFEQVKERALDESDYLNGKSEFSKEDLRVLIPLVGTLTGLPLLAVLIALVLVYLRRRQMLGDDAHIGHSFQLPDDSSLFKAHALLKHLSYLSGNEHEKLLNTYLVHLFVRGIFTLTEEEEKGKHEARLKVNPWHDQELNEDDREMEQLLYNLIYEATDSSNIFRPEALQKRDHSKEAEKLHDALERKVTLTTADNEMARQLFRLKRYLKNYTTIDQLPLQEMGVWKQTLVYATLFGCSKKVIAELERLCPHPEALAGAGMNQPQTEAANLLLCQQLIQVASPVYTTTSGNLASLGGGRGATGCSVGGGGR